MRIFIEEKNTIIEDVNDFSLSQTLECGQCFRFFKLCEDEYVIIAKQRLLHIKQEENKLIFYNTSKEDVCDIWLNYFDLNRDYAHIKKVLLEKDKKLLNAINEKWGVRILNQDFDEVLISFIISQNKQIPHIKKIVNDISKKYGKFIGNVGGNDYYAFPQKEELLKISEENFRECKTGFRAAYLVDACNKLALGLSKDTFNRLTYEEALKKLKEIKGVGDKVANCVMLFSLGYREAFPVDVWIERIMNEYYFENTATKDRIIEFASEHYAEYGGYAQQYLFFYERDLKLKSDKNK